MFESITTNIMVDNVEETIKFYEKVIGFETVVSVPGDGEKFQFAILKKDAISLMFQSKKTLMEEYPSLQADEIKPAFTLFITVSDVEKIYHELLEKVEIVKELHETFYGKLEFAIYDNNKNILTISC